MLTEEVYILITLKKKHFKKYIHELKENKRHLFGKLKEMTDKN